VLLIAGILNSLGALCIVAGALVQGQQQFRDWVEQVRASDANETWRPDHIEFSGKPVFLSIRNYGFGSMYGWNYIVLGGAFVFAGSLLDLVSRF
jgi:hypothetical protein